MRTDLSAAFLAELDKDNRYPITLCEFHFSDGTRYLADQPVGIAEGLARNYEPIVETWGNLKDNVRLEPIVGGKSLEVRQFSVTLVNIGDPPFSQKFKDVNPENVKVYLYQWFAGLDESEKALIDIFVCQDPIVVSEAQSLVTIQLVSPIMAKNPYIWGPNKFLEVRYPMVLGKWRTVARSMETGPTAFLLYDIDQTFTGEVFLDKNSTKDKWPTPPFNVYIDSEQLTVDSMEISKMNITGRGQAGTTARPHIRGALVCDPTAQYDYSLTAGPVGVIDNILADDEIYNNPVTILEGQDPAILRFDGRPPWHKVEAGAPGEPILPPEETTDQYGVSSETDNEVVGAPSNPGNINNAGSNAVMSFTNAVGNESNSTEHAGGTEWDSPPPEPNELAVIEVINPDGALDSNNNNKAIIRHDSDESAQVIVETFNYYFGVNNFPNLSSLGTFVSVEFKAYVESTGTDGIFNNSGNELQFHVNGIDKDSTRLWGVKGKQFLSGVVSEITSWSQLSSASVGFYWDLTSLDETSPRTAFEVEVWNLEAIVTYIGNDDPTYPKQEVVSHFNRDLSSLGAFVSAEVQVRFDCSNINCTLDQDIVFRTDPDPATNQVLWGRTISSTQGMATVSVYPSIGSMATLKNARVGVRHWLVSPTTPGVSRSATTNILYVLWKIRYQPGAIDQPDEERVIYVVELTADVTALSGERMTPARAIENLLTNVGDMGEYVDTANFDEKNQQYDAAQYYFNGLIDGETRLHDALKSLIRQGSTRLSWNAGKVKLASSFVESLEPVVPDPATVEMVRGQSTALIQAEQETQYIFKVDQRQRSATERRMRFDDIRNKVTIRYKPDYKLAEWLGDVEYRDELSITQIGEQEESFDYPYVSNDDIIDQIGARMLELKGKPRAFDTFRCYFKAFPFEKSDQVFIETDFNQYYGVVGPVMTVNRIFGSGKAGKMNVFEVTLLSTPIVAHDLEILDVINVNETYRNLPGFSIHAQIADVINVNETYNNDVQFTRFLELFDVVQVQETVGRLQGVQKSLSLEDTIELADALSTQSVLPINLAIEDTIELKETLDEEIQHEVRLELFDVIEVNALVDRLDTITGFYGTGGYGEGGYGGSLAYSVVYFKTSFVTFGGDDVIHYN